MENRLPSQIVYAESASHDLNRPINIVPVCDSGSQAKTGKRRRRNTGPATQARMQLTKKLNVENNCAGQ